MVIEVIDMKAVYLVHWTNAGMRHGGNIKHNKASAELLAEMLSEHEMTDITVTNTETGEVENRR